MEIEIIVGGMSPSDTHIADSAAHLLKELRVAVDPAAKLVTWDGQVNERGALSSFSQIVLGLVNSGAISKFITAVFSFVSLNRKLHLSVKKANGEAIDISLDYLDRNGANKAMELVSTFLTNGS